MNSYLEYLVEKGCININTLPLNEAHDAEGIHIAKALGIRLNGWWDELHKWLFTDDSVTQSSFSAKSMEEAKHKLKNLRASFEKAKITHSLQPA
jgi:hypothetical protein